MYQNYNQHPMPQQPMMVDPRFMQPQDQIVPPMQQFSPPPPQFIPPQMNQQPMLVPPPGPMPQRQMTAVEYAAMMKEMETQRSNAEREAIMKPFYAKSAISPIQPSFNNGYNQLMGYSNSAPAMNLTAVVPNHNAPSLQTSLDGGLKAARHLYEMMLQDEKERGLTPQEQQRKEQLRLQLEELKVESEIRYRERLRKYNADNGAISNNNVNPNTNVNHTSRVTTSNFANSILKSQLQSEGQHSVNTNSNRNVNTANNNMTVLNKKMVIDFLDSNPIVLHEILEYYTPKVMQQMKNELKQQVSKEVIHENKNAFRLTRPDQIIKDGVKLTAVPGNETPLIVAEDRIEDINVDANNFFVREVKQNPDCQKAKYDLKLKVEKEKTVKSMKEVYENIDLQKENCLLVNREDSDVLTTDATLDAAELERLNVDLHNLSMTNFHKFLGVAPKELKDYIDKKYTDVLNNMFRFYAVTKVYVDSFIEDYCDLIEHIKTIDNLIIKENMARCIKNVITMICKLEIKVIKTYGNTTVSFEILNKDNKTLFIANDKVIDNLEDYFTRNVAGVVNRVGFRDLYLLLNSCESDDFELVLAGKYGLHNTVYLVHKINDVYYIVVK